MSDPLKSVFVAFAHVEAPADAPNEDCLGVYTTAEKAMARVVLCDCDPVTPPNVYVWGRTNGEGEPQEWECWLTQEDEEATFPLGWVREVKLDAI